MTIADEDESGAMTEDAVPKRFGSWTHIGFVDARTAKRALCRCDCGALRELSVEALASGNAVPCSSCEPPRNLTDPRSRTFAREVADMASRGARRRQFGRDG